MSYRRLAFIFASVLALAGAQLAFAQSGPSEAPAKAAVSKHHKTDRAKPPSTAMDVGGAESANAPTGPYTNTSDAPATSDLSGSTGPGVTTPAAPPPPGVAPPNGGAPDTGGAETPNTAGGPHA